MPYAAPRMDPHHSAGEPEPMIVGWTPLLAKHATILDVAAGGGRHARWFAERGHSVTAVDRDVTALRALAIPTIELVEADLEGDPWPLGDRTFDAVVVVNYLWRPLLPQLVASVTPGGLLLYETFAEGNERFGRPSNPDYLLRSGELLDMTDELEVLEYGHGEVGDPPHAVRQRLLARRSS